MDGTVGERGIDNSPDGMFGDFTENANDVAKIIRVDDRTSFARTLHHPDIAYSNHFSMAISNFRKAGIKSRVEDMMEIANNMTSVGGRRVRDFLEGTTQLLTIDANGKPLNGTFVGERNGSKNNKSDRNPQPKI